MLCKRLELCETIWGDSRLNDIFARGITAKLSLLEAKEVYIGTLSFLFYVGTLTLCVCRISTKRMKRGQTSHIILEHGGVGAAGSKNRAGLQEAKLTL